MAKLQYAANIAEKYGDTSTQDVIKKMQNPGATADDGSTDYSKMSSEDRQQRYRTQDIRKKLAKRPLKVKSALADKLKKKASDDDDDE